MAQVKSKGSPKVEVKEQARSLLDKLPDNATWDDVLYALQTRLAIEDGRKACREGRVTPQDDIDKLFGVTK